MRRLVVAGLLVIAAQGALAIALIAWWTREDPPRSSIASAADAEEWTAPSAEALAARALEPAGVGPGPARASPGEPVVADTARARFDASLREGTPAPVRHALRSFRRDMKAGFSALKRRVAPCQAGDASFTLQLETIEAGIRVVDAQLEARGSSTEEGVACALSALVGETIPAPSAHPGRRWEMSFAAGSAI